MFHLTPPKSWSATLAGTLSFALVVGSGLSAVTASSNASANTPQEVADEPAAIRAEELDARLARLLEKASADLGTRANATADRIAGEASSSQLTAMIERSTRRSRAAASASRR